MTKLSYLHFVELLGKYEKFDDKILNAMYNEFGKTTINEYFEEYYQKLDESEATEFIKKYSVYFEQELKEINDSILSFDTNVSDSADMIIKNTYNYTLMSPEFERAQGEILKDAKLKLNIINRDNEEEYLYPMLQLEKIFLSVKNKEDLVNLDLLRKIPFSLGDDSIFKKERTIIKKFLSLSDDKLLSIDELKKEFPDLSFDNVEIIENLSEQIELLKKYIFAKFNFYNRNLRLVVFIAKKGGNIIPLEEKLQEGNISLIKAINRYDVSKGYKFSTYAIWWIKQGILRYLDNAGSLIRKPVHFNEKIKKYKKFYENYVFINGVEPTLKECSDSLNMTEDEIINLRLVSMDILSLDETVSDLEDGDNLINFIVDDRVNVEEEIISEDFVNVIKKYIFMYLNERESTILINRFGLNDENTVYTLQQIANKLGITRERVRQIEVKSRRKLLTKLRVNDILSVGE